MAFRIVISNKTPSILNYAGGTITVPANTDYLVPINQNYAAATDAQIRLDVVGDDANTAKITISDTVTEYGSFDAIVYLNLIIGLIDQDGQPFGAANPLYVAANDFDIRNLTFAQDKVDVTGSTVSVAAFPTIQDVNIVSSIEIEIKNDAGNPVPVSGTVTALQGTNPWIIGDGGNSITVDAVLFDIRDLTFARDKVDVSGSTNLGLDAATLAALESITVQNPAGAGAVNIQDGGNSITVDAVLFDIRDLTFARDKVDVSGSTVTVNQGTSPWVVTTPAGAGATEATLSSLNAKFNQNYGASTGAIRTASQIGNVTGAADFAAGATTTQTLRTTSNQGTPNTAANAWPLKITDNTGSAIVDIQIGPSTSQPTTASGLVTNARNYLFGSSAWEPYKDAQAGNNSVANGLAASAAYGQYNATQPTVTDGRYTALQTDNRGNLLIGSTGVKSTNNSRTVAIGASQTFTGAGDDVLKYQNITLTVYYSQITTFKVQWSDDNATWIDDGDTYTVSANTLKKTTFGRVLQYFRPVVVNTAGMGANGFTTVIYDSPRPKPSSHRLAEMMSPDSDAELVKAVLSGFPLTYSAPASATVGLTSASALAANAARKGLILVNRSLATISIAFGNPAVLNSGITLTPNGTYVMEPLTATTQQMFAIASLVGSVLSIQEIT